MAAFAGVAPQILFASPSVFTLLDDCWYSTPVFNRTSVGFPSAEKNTGKVTVCTPAGEVGIEERSWLAPTSGFLEESSISGRDGTEERFAKGSIPGSIRRLHSFDEQEMKAVFGMLDKNSDGVICEAELREFMSILGMDMSKLEAHSMIQSLDGNRDGEIDFEEFFSLYRTSLEGHEMLMEMEKTEQEDTEILSEAFRIFDRNNDGFISAQELQAVLVGLGVPAGKSLKQCQKMIANVDQDGNGKCDIHEFLSMMSAQLFLQKRR